MDFDSAPCEGMFYLVKVHDFRDYPNHLFAILDC